MNKIKAVIFDLDGTLGNTLPLCIAVFKNSIEPLINHSLSDEKILATFVLSEERTIIGLSPQNHERAISFQIA
ncbi:hypothetical protein EZ449_12940 [Pedobacter frigidisoli]|uniref:Uncharacterized protein n=1 Tax=Pedobacter frigidisoli TaxID=2530455 RepID=A0A4R0P2K8_9SPHI|nr:HAD hydrolase-like protein [Pedobacter frigidisoli]TCD08303.1 hypothetical protein EZ449_12940 [Pedobacter frigidisoli]